MGNMTRLLRQLGELENDIKRCMRCGLCQAACPLYAHTGKETLVARGKIALLNGLSRQMIEDAAGVQERLTTCLMCGSCAASCPSGVKVIDIFFRARTILAGYRGLPWAKKMVFRRLLSHPALFRHLLSLAARCQRLVMRQASPILGTVTSPLLSPMIGKRHLTPLSSQAFTDGHGINTSTGKSGLRVAFFPGCMVYHMFPDIGRAVLRVLEHHGVGVALPPMQACCGIPAMATGDDKSCRALLAHNLQAFAKQSFDYIVTACSSCAYTMRKLWPSLAADWPAEDRQRIAEMAAKTTEISVFLVDHLHLQLPSASNQDATRLTYHDPCHLKKSLGVHAQPRALLRANPRYALVEMNGADVCCGCGGSFTLDHYDLSARIGNAKRDNIVASGAEVVATSCPACMMQMSDMLSQHNDRVRVKHAVEIYAESLA